MNFYVLSLSVNIVSMLLFKSSYVRFLSANSDFANIKFT